MPEKKTYCKNCGGLINNKTKKCTSCGRQYFRFSKRVFVISVVAIIAIGLVGANVYQYITNKQSVELLNNNLESIRINRDEYIKRSSDLTVQLISKDKELNFWNEYAVIVTEAGEKYHHYGCYHLNDCSSIWIYNIAAAESLGYEPCLDCCGG